MITEVEVKNVEQCIGRQLIEVEKRIDGACCDDSEEVVLHFDDGSEISVYFVHGKVVVEGD